MTMVTQSFSQDVERFEKSGYGVLPKAHRSEAYTKAVGAEPEPKLPKLTESLCNCCQNLLIITNQASLTPN